MKEKEPNVRWGTQLALAAHFSALPSQVSTFKRRLIRAGAQAAAASKWGGETRALRAGSVTEADAQPELQTQLSMRNRHLKIRNVD